MSDRRQTPTPIASNGSRARPFLLAALLCVCPPETVLGGPDPHTGLKAGGRAKVALQHYQAGRVDQALTVLTSGIERFPDEPALLVVRAGILTEQQQPDAALADLEVAAKLAPDNPMVLTNRAQLYRGAERDDDALKDLNRVVSIAPDYVAARYNRGSLRYEQGDYQGALQDFDHCIAIDPHLSAAYFNRANARAALGDHAAAIADIDRFVDIADDAHWLVRARQLRAEWEAARGDAD